MSNAKPTHSRLYRVSAAVLCGTTYETVQRLSVRSVRLRALHTACRVAVFAYVVLYEMLLRRSYLAMEAPEATYNTWGAYPTDGSPVIPPAARQHVCAPDTLAAMPWGDGQPVAVAATSGYYSTGNVTCGDFDPGLHTVNRPGSVSLVTSEVVEGADRSNPRTTVFAGVDYALFNVIHAGSVSFGSFTNPPARVVDTAGVTRHEFPAGAYLGGIPVGEWLDIAGLPHGLNGTQADFSGNGITPALRVTGLMVLVRMSYSNAREGEWPWQDSTRCDVTAEVMAGAWGFLGTRSEVRRQPDGELATVRVTQNAVTFVFVTSGEMGAVSGREIMWNLIELLVYFELAAFLIDMVALQYLTKRAPTGAEPQAAARRAGGGKVELRAVNKSRPVIPTPAAGHGNAPPPHPPPHDPPHPPPPSSSPPPSSLSSPPAPRTRHQLRQRPAAAAVTQRGGGPAASGSAAVRPPLPPTARQHGGPSTAPTAV